MWRIAFIADSLEATDILNPSISPQDFGDVPY